MVQAPPRSPRGCNHRVPVLGAPSLFSDMRRDTAALAQATHDVLVVGGGIVGAFLAWDASLRGLSVALIEKSDFGGATSANHLKIIHGGLRYLQKGNLRRLRESRRERMILMRMARYLIHPLPVLVPTYNSLLRGKEAFHAAFALESLLGGGGESSADLEAALPDGRILGREECLEKFPGFAAEELTGGALWYDGQVRHPERFTMAVLHSAAERGAVIVNYVRADSLLLRARRVEGVRAFDAETGDTFDIRASLVIDATGPHSQQLLGKALQLDRAVPPLALAVNLILGRRFSDVAVGVRSRTSATEDPVCGGNRFIFLVPWRESTLVGTAYVPLHDGISRIRVTEELLQSFLSDVTTATGGSALVGGDVQHFHAGLVPLKQGRERGRPNALAEHAYIVDHAKTHKIPGLISVQGVKYTTARRVAEQTLDLAFKRMGYRPPHCLTSVHPAYGGAPSHSPSLHREDDLHARERLSELHGSGADRIIRASLHASGAFHPIGRSKVLRCEVTHAVQNEMAVRLCDVVLRRTDLGTERCPPLGEIREVAGMMADSLGWSVERTASEVEDVLQSYDCFPEAALPSRMAV